MTQQYSTVSPEDQANRAGPIEEFPKLKEQQEDTKLVGGLNSLQNLVLRNDQKKFIHAGVSCHPPRVADASDSISVVDSTTASLSA